MSVQLSRKAIYSWLSLILLITEIIIAKYIPGDNFIRHSVGDFLVVILIFCIIQAIDHVPAKRLAIAICLFAFSIEILQYFHIVDILQIHNQTLRILIGNTFSWLDLLMYLSGSIATYFLDKAIQFYYSFQKSSMMSE